MIEDHFTFSICLQFCPLVINPSTEQTTFASVTTKQSSITFFTFLRQYTSGSGESRGSNDFSGSGGSRGSDNFVVGPGVVTISVAAMGPGVVTTSVAVVRPGVVTEQTVTSAAVVYTM